MGKGNDFFCFLPKIKIFIIFAHRKNYKKVLEIITDIAQYQSQQPLALSIGMFDGVHIGHQEIIKKLHQVAENQNLIPSILTFTPHPRLVFNPDDDLCFLNTSKEKNELLQHTGIQHLFIQEFDKDFRNLTGEEFIKEILVKKLNVKYLIIGYDHSFGKNRSGNFELLQKFSSEFGYQVEKIEEININHHTISSTQIRNALSEGNIQKANEMLGYFYPLSGKVIHGKKLGRTIGYPTANIEVEDRKLLPKKGAYIVEVYIDNQRYKGMLSVGTNPTVGGEKLSVEVYILDFNENIYDKEIKVLFREFLHEEIKFENIEQLIKRLDEDKIITENFDF